MGSQEIQLITSRTESILKSLIANYSKWELAQERGLALCRNIEAKKTKCLQNNGSDLYPNEIESYCSKLKRLLDIFKDISSDADESYRNLKALQKLNKCSEDPLFWTCSLENLLNYCGNIRETYSAEVKTKLKIIENIAHGSNRTELIYYTSLWQYPFDANDELKMIFAFIKKELLYSINK